MAPPAFNSIPQQALFHTLQYCNLPIHLIDTLKHLYTHPYDRPLINGQRMGEHKQIRGVRQGCPLSPLLFNLYLDIILHTLRKHCAFTENDTIHSYIHDILIRSNNPLLINETNSDFNNLQSLSLTHSEYILLIDMVLIPMLHYGLLAHNLHITQLHTIQSGDACASSDTCLQRHRQRIYISTKATGWSRPEALSVDMPCPECQSSNMISERASELYTDDLQNSTQSKN